MDEMERLSFRNRNEWRKWLKDYHNIAKGIWLVYYKKHIKKPSVYYNDAVEEALCFGWIDSMVKRIDDERYMQKYTPRNANSSWSASNKQRVEKIIGRLVMRLCFQLTGLPVFKLILRYFSKLLIQLR